MSEERFKGDYEQPGDEERKAGSENSFDELPKKNEDNYEYKDVLARDNRSQLVEKERRKLIEPVGLLAVLAFFVLIAWSIVKGKSALNATVSVLGILLVVLIASHYGYALNKATISKTTQKMYNDWVLNAADFRHNKAMHTLTIKQYGMRCLMLAVEAITCVAEAFFLTAEQTKIVTIFNNEGILSSVPVAIGIVSLVLAFGLAVPLITVFVLTLVKPLDERVKKDDSRFTFIDRWALLRMPPKNK